MIVTDFTEQLKFIGGNPPSWEECVLHLDLLVLQRVRSIKQPLLLLFLLFDFVYFDNVIDELVEKFRARGLTLVLRDKLGFNWLSPERNFLVVA